MSPIQKDIQTVFECNITSVFRNNFQTPNRYIINPFSDSIVVVLLRNSPISDLQEATAFEFSSTPAPAY